MTAPFLNDKLIKYAFNAGVGTVFALILLYLLSNAMAYQTQKIEALGPEIETIKLQHAQMMNDSEELKEALIREARKQTIMQQKTCVRLSTNRDETNDCLIFEP